MTKPDDVPLRLAGRLVLLLGELPMYIDRLKDAVKNEGARLTDKLSKRVDLIVDLPKKTKARTHSAWTARNKKTSPSPSPGA